MTLPRTSFRDFLAVPPICLLVLCFASVELRAQGDQPPAEPPADWGPISINMEEIEYPHPVHFLNLNLYGQDVRIAYMDVPPVGPPNGPDRGVPSRLGATTAGIGKNRSRPSVTRASVSS